MGVALSTRWCLLCGRAQVSAWANRRRGGGPLPIQRGSDVRLVEGRVGRGSRLVTASAALRRRALIGVVPTLVVLAVCLPAAPTASPFNAQGSVEQVYVTGLTSGAQMSLLKKNGETVATQNADALGGLLFRDVAP